jgi:hypothetical protein
VVYRWLENKERVLVLPVYTIKGYITAITFYGTYTGQIFENFIIKQLLPLYNPYPSPRLVIIINNALIYYSN